MGETTLRKQEFEEITCFLQSQNIATKTWAEHGHWKAISINGVGILYTLRGGGDRISSRSADTNSTRRDLTSQKERECKQRAYKPEEVEIDKRHIREK